MLLAIDIGNTNIVIGCIKDDEILFQARIATDRIKTSDQYGVEIKNMLETFGVSREDIEGCIISSVVPPVFNSVQTGVRKVIGRQPMVVGPGLKTGLNIRLENPSQMGAALVAADVGALREYQPPLIIIDMGTATTMSVLDETGAHLGGCVCPGVKIGLEALTARTSLLPGIQLDRPERVLGRNTADAMRSGIMYGAASMLDGMIDRFREELGCDFNIIATGGLAEQIVPLCRHEMVYDHNLIIKGLAALYRDNAR